MEFIQLADDMNVSRICLGAWQFNDGQQTNDKTHPGQTYETSKKILDTAFECGINFIDTAEAYLNSESVLGRALQGRNRKDFVIASKFAGSTIGSSTEPWPVGAIEPALDASLGRLQLSFLDLYQVHWPIMIGDWEATIAELERLKSIGKIRHYGVSNSGVKNLAAISEGRGKPLTNQLPYNMLWRPVEYGVLDACERLGVKTLAYSPLQQGLLTGKYMKLEDVPEGRRRMRLFNQSSSSLSRHGGEGQEKILFSTLNSLRSICDDAGIKMSQAAVAWLLERPTVAAVVVGASSPGQLVENCKLVKLSKEVSDRLTAATDELKAGVGAAPDMWAPKSRTE